MRSPLLMALCTALLGCSSLSYPKSAQWHEGRFENPPEWPKFPGPRELFRWLASRPQAFPPFTPRVAANDGKLLRADREHLSITWIGHASLLVQGAGVSVLTDPVFGKRVGVYARFAPPGVLPRDLPPIDIVVISHNHYDHLDESSVKQLGASVHYVVPLGLAEWFRKRGLRQVTELDWWETTEIATPSGGKATLTLVPAQHWSRRSVFDERRSLWGGYMIDLDRPAAAPGSGSGGSHAGRIYFAGDTGYPAAFREVGRRFPGIDYALMPIGAYEPRWFMHPQHLAPEETARAFLEVGARTLIPMHYATFRLADEDMEEPPRLLRQALGQDALRLIELAIGETRWGGPESPPQK